MVFKFLKAFLIAFFNLFLEAKYFPPSVVNTVSLAFLLLMTEWSSCRLSFDICRHSLAVLQISKNLKDPSRMPSTHLSLNHYAKACCLIGNCSNLSAQSCKSRKALSLWLNEDDDIEEVALESLNLWRCSSFCDMSGWGVEGNLLEWVLSFRG